MKKLTSLLLALVMLFTALTLSGCGEDKINPLELEGYSELSTDDIKIVKNYHKSFKDNFVQLLPPEQTTFEEKIDSIKEGKNTFYEVNIKECYYICGYINPIVESVLYFTVGIDSDNIEWYAINNPDSIVNEINGMERVATYLVYNGAIETDVFNNTPIGSNCKFSILLNGDELFTELTAKLRNNDRLLVFDKLDLSSQDGAILYYQSDIYNSYPIHVNNESTKLLLLQHSITYSYQEDKTECISTQLGMYYEKMLPLLVFDDKLNEKIYVDDLGNRIYSGIPQSEERFITVINVGISISDVAEIVK